MELTPGLGQGLSFQINYNDRINQLHSNEDRDRRAASEAAQKAALIAKEAEYISPMNSHDAEIVKSQARQTIRKMGEYRRNNPDMQFNPDKLIEFNQIQRSLKDNPDLIRGMSSDKNYSEYVKDLQEMAKNPAMHDTEAYDNIKLQWDNYLKYGNQNGLEASQKEGKKAFLYTKPQDFVDLPTTFEKAGDGIHNYDVRKGSNIGEWWTEPNKDQLNAIKRSIYQQHGRQISVEAKKLGFKTPEEVDKWVNDGISAGFKRNYNIGDANALWERNYKMQQLGLEKEKIDAKKGGPSYTPWDHFTDPRNRAGTVPVDLARKIWNDRPKMEITGFGGTKADLTGYDLEYDGRFVKNKDNTPFLLGSVKMPIQDAIQRGIVKEKGALSDDDATDAYNVKDINGPFLGQAWIQSATDKTGGQYQYVKIDYHLPVNINDVTARQMYNVQADVDKLVPASKDPYSQAGGKKVAPTGAGVDQKGNVFDASGNYLGPVSDFQ